MQIIIIILFIFVPVFWYSVMRVPLGQPWNKTTILFPTYFNVELSTN